jgi:hypothetical protein
LLLINESTQSNQVHRINATQVPTMKLSFSSVLVFMNMWTIWKIANSRFCNTVHKSLSFVIDVDHWMLYISCVKIGQERRIEISMKPNKLLCFSICC